MKAGLFDVLKKMNTEHEGSVHAYFSNNIKNLNAGSKGWGDVKIAIVTGDAQELMTSSLSGHVTKTLVLFVIDREVMDQTKEDIEVGNEKDVEDADG